MKFRTRVEPPEPMRGLEVPPEVVQALGAGKRPAVTITINGHQRCRKRRHDAARDVGSGASWECA
jgi:hypothetical protein